VSLTNPVKNSDGGDSGSPLMGIYAAKEDCVCGQGLVKEGRLLPKGGVGGSETRGKEVVPDQNKSRKEIELAVKNQGRLIGGCHE